jgi:hypothetical protein
MPRGAVTNFCLFQTSTLRGIGITFFAVVFRGLAANQALASFLVASPL